MRKKNAITIFVVLLFLGWFLGTGLVFVPPKTVQVVRGPSPVSSLLIVEYPIINNTGFTELHFSWPRIPFTPIGIKEESYSLAGPQPIKIKMELGKIENNKTVFLEVSGTAEVKNWEEFLVRFNPYLYGREAFLLKLIYPKLANEGWPTSRTRFQLLEGEIKATAEFQFYRYYFVTFPDFYMRAQLAESLVKEHGFTEKQEVEELLKTSKPWIWALGPLYFKQIRQEFERYPLFDPSAARLGQAAFLAGILEDDENFLDWQMALIEKQAALGGGLGLEAERELLLEEKEDVVSKQKKIRSFFTSLPSYKSESNASLWRAAIRQGLYYGLVDPVDGYYSWLEADGMKYFDKEAFGYDLLIVDLELTSSLTVKTGAAD